MRIRLTLPPLALALLFPAGAFAQGSGFTNDVVPTLTRLGCNSGGCHGKVAGQNGFKLSLFGFEPEEDYEHLKRDALGRRLNLTDPDQSLLLLKATGSVPHGGGALTHKNSPYYAILHRWISEGALWKGDKDASLTRIEVQPAANIIQRGGSQKLAVKAYFADGTQRDVTHLAQFKADPPEAISVDDTGLASVGQQAVSGSIMARYQDQVAVSRIVVPHGAKVANLPPARNFIDELIFKQWKAIGLPPSPLCDDATFLRRVTIDIAGRIPTPEEVEAFAKDKAEDRHEKLVDRLLASEDYAYYFANKWAAVLRNRRNNSNEDSKGTTLFHKWIVKSLHENVPFNTFVREILTATGEEGETPQVVWYRELRGSSGLAEDTAQLFLGQRVQCAKCHHHPTERWSQRDYWSLTAFFARTDVQLPNPKSNKGMPKAPKRPTVVLKFEADQITHPRTGETLAPAGLGAKAIKTAEEGDARAALADWITDPKNPYFARTLVNRYWKHFMGRGLVEPEDDMRATNPPTNPELLDALAKHFIDSKYDLKALVRIICLSSTYRLSCEPNKDNAQDRQNYSRFTIRRLPAEVLLDAINQVTLSKPMTPQSRTVRLPDNQSASYFLKAFGRPEGASACECDRSSSHNLAQMLHLFNSTEILGQIGDVLKDEPPPKVGKQSIANPTPKVTAGARIQKLATDKRPHYERIRELYLAAFAREPSTEEVANLEAHIERRGDVRAAYADILWALLNSSEFMYNH